MRRYIFLLALVFSCFLSYGQTNEVRANRIIADEAMFPPVRDTNFTPQRVGQITYKTSDSYTYYAISTSAAKKWERLAKYTDVPVGGSTNVNIGSGYRLAVPNTNNIKTLFAAYGTSIDSTTNANGLTFRVDSASLALTFLRLKDSSLYATQYDISLKVDSVRTNADSTKLLEWKNGFFYEVYDFTKAMSGGDTTVFETVLDSTAQAGQRVLFSGGSKIRSDPFLLYDSVNNKLMINHNNISAGGNGIKLWVTGNSNFNGIVTANSFVKTGGTSSQFLKADGSVDATTYTPTSRTLTAGYGLTGGGDLSANRSFVLDSATVASYFLRRKDSSVNGGYYPYATNPKSYLVAADLSGYVQTTRTLTAIAPITGGGDLSANRSFGIDTAQTGTGAVVNHSRLKQKLDSLSALGLTTNIYNSDGYLTTADRYVKGLNDTRGIVFDSVSYFMVTHDGESRIYMNSLGTNISAPNNSLGQVSVTDDGIVLSTGGSDITLDADSVYINTTGGNISIETIDSGSDTTAFKPLAWNASTKRMVVHSYWPSGGGSYTDEMAQDAIGAMVDGTLIYTDGTPLLSRAALTGDVTASAGSNATTIANDAVTYAKMQNVGANSVLARVAGTSGDLSEIALSASNLLGRGSTGDVAAITVGGILSFSGTVLSATEVDGSTSNELQTIANTSDATSHTVTLSNSGGSFQLIEGSGITLTTGGSGSAGTITIAGTGSGSQTQQQTFDIGNTLTRIDSFNLIANTGLHIGAKTNGFFQFKQDSSTTFQRRVFMSTHLDSNLMIISGINNNSPTTGLPVEQLVIRNPSDTGSKQQAMIGFKVWDGAAHTINGWIGNTAGTYNVGSGIAKNTMYMESDSNGTALLANNLAGRHQFYVGSFAASSSLRSQITKDSVSFYLENLYQYRPNGSTKELMLSNTHQSGTHFYYNDANPRGLNLNKTVGSSGTPSADYMPLNFLGPSSVNIGQVLMTTSTYSNAAINVPASSLGLLANVNSLSLIAGVAGKDIRFTVGGYSSSNQVMFMKSDSISSTNRISYLTNVASTFTGYSLVHKIYVDSSIAAAVIGGGGYTNLTQFVAQTNWQIFYSNGSGDVTELTVGAANTVLLGNGVTSAPSWGTVPNAALTNSTISGIALGSNLANLTATDGTLTFSGTYTGATARTIGINLGNANTWSADQSVPDEAYDATAWNGSMEVPTKNALRDKIETLGSSSLTVGTSPITSGTEGALFFEGSGNVLQQDATNLFWDNSNNRLGIGTNSPAAGMRLDAVGGSIRTDSWLYAGTKANTYSGYVGVILGNNAVDGTHSLLDFWDNGSRIAEFYTTSSSFNFFTDTGKDLMFHTDNDFSNPLIYGGTNQRVGINMASPGYTLHVNGIAGLENHLVLKDISAPSTPASGYGALYVNGDVLYFKDDAGNVTDLLAGGSGGHIIEEEGTPLAAQPDLNFIGAGITAADDAGNTATTVTLDSDLNTIAGLTATTDNFLVSVSSAWASRTPSQVRTTLALVIGTNVQAWDTDLDTWAGITPGSNVGTFLATPSSANLRSAITDENGTGALLFSANTSAVFNTAVLDGAVTGTGVATGATASTLVKRDGDANITANNWLGGYTTTATAAGTTTLTVASTFLQFFTGATTQTVTLPVTSTLTLGHQFTIVNNSSGAVTINSSGGNAVVIVAGGTSAVVTCILTSGTSAASWSQSYSAVSVASGKKITWNNSLTLTGTDGTTMTFPTTSATLARTDAAQTFTGIQTFSSAMVLSTGTVTVSGNTITFPSSASTLATLSLTEEFQNKTITKRTGTTASSATPTINADNVDLYTITAQAVDITSMTTNFTLPTNDGDEVEIWITGTASRAITWGASFAAGLIALPTTTSGTSTLRMSFVRTGSVMTIKGVY